MENTNKLTLGSLFSGSGGFELAGMLSGIEPTWASEIEPFPIRVTTKRMPNVKHYGDVSALNGAEIEPVDIITFGSPCHDMSIAGKREGLDGNRSGLFYQAVRIIKEMREKTNGKYPRYIVWENVPGAFSSNKGEDFRCVLESICHIADETVSVPSVKKWQYAGEIVGDGYSVAWRLLDAQYWGVPQRRKRIYLVADFAGGSAGKILFESEGLSGYSAESFRSWQRAAGGAEEGAHPAGVGTDGYNGAVSEVAALSPKTCAVSEVAATLGVNCGMSTGRNGIVLNDQGGNRMDVTEEVTSTLRAEAHHPPCVMESAGFRTEHSAKSRSIGYEEETSPTLCAGVVPATVYENHGQDCRYTGPLDKSQTVSATYGTGGNNQPLVVQKPKTLKIRSGCEGGGKGALIQDDKSATLGTHNDQTLFQPKVYGICSKDSNAMKSANPHSGFYEADTSRCLDASGGNPNCNQGGIAVVAVQGSMIGRAEKNGPQGSGVGEDVSFTLDATDRHAVAYGIDRAAYNQGQNAKFGFAVETEVEPTIVAKGPGAVAEPTYSSSRTSFFTEATEETASTLMATDYKDPPLINDKDEADYIVRRLTPTECARLQGFPGWWCADLGEENPTDDEIAFWRDVFETHRKVITGAKKPKTRAQIVKWLKSPHSDSAEYKMWGNGIALPCAQFVLNGIAYFDKYGQERGEKAK